MPIIRARNHIEVYQARALMTDIHELSGRGNNYTLTKFINDRIVSFLRFNELEHVVLILGVVMVLF